MAAGQVAQFQAISHEAVPHELLASEDLCGNLKTPEGDECSRSFVETGKAWVADLNGDGRNEWLIFLGSRDSGSGGNWFHLFQNKNGEWVQLGEGWQTRRARFDILPRTHQGYPDLRVAVDWCLKWDGQAYVNYDPEDDRQLSPEWFDSKDPFEAEIFWWIRYAGLTKMQFEPLWVTFDEKKYSSPNTEMKDEPQGIRWLAFFKGGVWGVKANQAFLLLPQLDYRGSEKLEFRGDWLLIFGEADVLVARYNRRTRDLILLPREP
jgi:hypothetical protein